MMQMKDLLYVGPTYIKQVDRGMIIPGTYPSTIPTIYLVDPSTNTVGPTTRTAAIVVSVFYSVLLQDYSK